MNTQNLVTNPVIVLREEFDDWVLVFNPDTNEIFSLNPVGAFILKCLDGKTSVEEIIKRLEETCDNIPVDATDYVSDFIKELLKYGLVTYKEN
ncbi:MAG: PqqD family peptide modification chaperone [Candidatus Omnitrophica bacterium]|nr:PqqD family peptide modification chaperone [Candidatus Omnitrophota bacterium]